MQLKGSKIFLAKSWSINLPLKKKRKEASRKSEVKKIQNQESIFNLFVGPLECLQLTATQLM